MSSKPSVSFLIKFNTRKVIAMRTPTIDMTPNYTASSLILIAKESIANVAVIDPI